MRFVFFTFSACGIRKGNLAVAAAMATFFTMSGAHAASTRTHSVVGGYTDNLPVATILRLAERGNAKYQTYLGYMYETGRNFPQDYQLAAYWYRCAADQGNVHAQYLLGLLYDRGQGVPLNYVEAHKWLNMAAARAGSGDRDYFVRIRNAVASKLTRAQIYKSQQRARDWTLGVR